MEMGNRILMIPIYNRGLKAFERGFDHQIDATESGSRVARPTFATGLSLGTSPQMRLASEFWGLANFSKFLAD